ncbi:MAG: hypothetical protein AAGG59_19865 [Bacteroidota bacterium]
MPRSKVIGYYLVGWIFTATSILMIYSENHWIGWVGAIFFGTGSILFTIKLIYPNFKYFNTDAIGNNYKPLTEEEFQEKYSDDGIFTFTFEGFTVELENEKLTVNWNEVESLIGYKIDLYTSDQICLDIFLVDKHFTISEETLGWYKFQEHLKNDLNIENPDWWIDIATPAFEPNYTTVFDHKNRTIQELLKKRYKKSM